MGAFHDNADEISWLCHHCKAKHLVSKLLLIPLSLSRIVISCSIMRTSPVLCSINQSSEMTTWFLKLDCHVLTIVSWYQAQFSQRQVYRQMKAGAPKLHKFTVVLRLGGNKPQPLK